jgi:hypothetical protein
MTRRLALAFGDAGFPIFPVNVFRRGERWRKVPYVKDWENAATTDPEILREWWLRWPLAMPGLPLERCGLCVVDADRHGEVDGVAAFRELGLMPRHPIVVTKSGGEHHWFRQPSTTISKTQNWRPGIDLLGASSFVVGYAVPEGNIPELPEVFWPSVGNLITVVSLNIPSPPPHHDPVVVADRTAALRRMNVRDWNGKHVEGGMIKEWFELLLGCKYAGISERDFVEWCVSDPDYADDAEEIARQWRHAVPAHGGAFWRELKKRKIKVGGNGCVQKQHSDEVPPTEPAPEPRSEPNLRRADARINSAIDAIDRDPTERCLFWAACLCAEIVHDCQLKKTRIEDLIEGNVSLTPLRKTLGKEGIRRTIANAFSHVEEKYLATPNGQKGN